MDFMFPGTAKFDLWLSQETIELAVKIIAGLIIFLVSYIAGIFSKWVIIRIEKRTGNTTGIYPLLAGAAKTVILALGFVSGLGTIGIDVSAIVAGLGLTGFALSFAFKDMLSNALSGILILLYKPISIKQKIKVMNYEGVVVNIDMRYTSLEIEGEPGRVLIPNSKIFNEVIKTC